MAAQALPPRPAPPLQRAVPAQIHRAPSRAARRASRVLPPSTDLQAFLSSTATDAASEFKWPAPTSVIVPEPVEVPHKRPASAMSAASEAPTSSNAVQMERILPDFLTQYVTIAKPLNQPSQGESEDVQHLESDKESAKKLQQPAPILSPAEVEVNEPHFAHEVLKSPAHKADSAQTEMSALVVQSGTPREPVIESAPSAATQQDSALNASEQSQKSEMVPPNSIVEVAHPLIEEATAVQAIETSGTLSNVEPEAALSIPSDKVPKASNLTERGLADIDTGVAAEGVTPQEHVVQPSEDVAPEPRMLDTAISTASKPVPSTTPVTLPLISASSRPRTAFMPRRRHRPAENVTPAAPSPSLPAHVLHPTSSVQGNKAAQWEPLAPMDAVNETSGPKNPLAASLGVRQSKALDSLSVTKQARSVSASVTVSNQAKASTVSSYAQAQSSRETSSRSVAGPSYARPTGGSERGAKPPPAKKQALSSSSGPSAGRLTTSTNASRSAANKPASGASAESVPPIGKGTSRTRPQGSIFSRLAAPTAASAARAKPRVASEARETFKKPASSTGILSKKNSTVSLKSSHGPTGTNAQPLRESTNKSTKTQAPVQTSGVVSKASNLHSLTNVPPSGDATTRDDNVAMEGQDQISGEDAPALAVVIEGEPMPSSKHAPKMIAPEREAENHRTDAGEEAQYQREQAQAETPVLAPSLKADETFHTASYVPLPCSPPGSDLPIILAELDLPGADENLQAVHNAITPVQLSGNAAVTAEGGDVSELPVQERLLSLSNNREDAVRPVGLSSSARDRKEKETVSSIPDTDSTPSFDLTHTATCTIDECADAEANHTADQTVIVNDLSDVQCAAPHEQAGQASHSSAASSPVQVSPSFSEQADTPKNYSQHSQNSMAFTSSNLSKSPTPESIPLPEDASLSLFVSPTKSMQDLLARSTGRQAEEESSPLLLEQEYHAPAIAAQYEYDETVLEASTVLPSRRESRENTSNRMAIKLILLADTEPEHADVDKKDAPLPEQANPEQEQEGDEEEDEFALMISRELSSDSLEELASRWEESRVMAGSLGLLGNTNDDFDLENTPMRPKMLTRLSDGQSSDYGRAPFDTGAYTKDDEDAALDILLSMGNQATMDWTEKAAILSESMVLPAAKQSQSQEHLNDKKHNRGVLAEMYMTGDTPRVDRHRPRKSASDKSERATQGAQVRTESILQEGGIF